MRVEISGTNDRNEVVRYEMTDGRYEERDLPMVKCRAELWGYALEKPRVTYVTLVFGNRTFRTTGNEWVELSPSVIDEAG